MGKVSNRAEIRARFQKTLDTGEGILVAAPGCGLNAKMAELGGCDALMILHTGLARQRGLPSIAKLEKPSNEIVKELFPDQFRVTEEIPILAGIDVGQFPADGDLNELIDSFLGMGFSGVVNFLSAGEIGSPEFVALAEQNFAEDELGRLQVKGELEMFEECRRKEALGVGFARELELIRLCDQRDIFTLVYVFSPEQAAQMAQAGADGICAHCGGTAGGTVGHRAVLDYGPAAKRLQNMFDAARAVNPQIFQLGHGGPFAGPADAAEMYRLCTADGFVAGSGIDRLPIEQAVRSAATRFKKARLAQQG